MTSLRTAWVTVDIVETARKNTKYILATKPFCLIFRADFSDRLTYFASLTRSDQQDTFMNYLIIRTCHAQNHFPLSRSLLNQQFCKR
jgi:hypothetical protein